MIITRDEAYKLLCEYTQSDSLRKHAFAVEAAMIKYAVKFREDENVWGACGLVHDFDYEKFPGEHPQKGAEILRAQNYPEEIIQAVLGHANHTGVKRESLMAKCLFAVDELCGFIIALAYVRPEKLNGLEPKSIRKNLKKKGFAAKISREDIALGIKELDVSEDEHYQLVINALQKIVKELGF